MTTEWTRACSAGGDCIEAAADDNVITLRNSTHPDLEIYATREEFTAFLDAAKNGELDHLTHTTPTP